MVLAPIVGQPFPVPVSMSEGQLAENKEDVNRLFFHFRAQGYEGVITKDLSGPYRLAERDPAWLKRKPEITLDLVLIGAVFAVTEKQNVGAFGSYVIAARKSDGSFEDVGDVAGLDRARDIEIQGEIMREGLATGRRIERPSASGVRSGLELRPSIVVTVKFEGIARDTVTGVLALRGPKVAQIRADKPASEADTKQAIEALYLRQRVG
jgi:DNA ligase-1